MALEFKTTRLSVLERSSEIEQNELSEILERVPELLSTPVVEYLPPYFQGIKSQSDAQLWFERMVSESRLFVVRHNDLDLIIGFIFASIENDHDAHIGYLLGEAYWGQGLASELLKGFIAQANKEKKWTKLVGGMDSSNIASSRLLVKLGFAKQHEPHDGSQVVFYEYQLSKPQP